MKYFLKKISSYNLFNNLFPGVLFVVATNQFTKYTIPYENLVVGAFVCYFIGMVISRIGSLFIEPILKKVSFLNFTDYSDFVNASKKDSKIDLLSEVNNTYRTLSSMFLLLLIIKFYAFLESKVCFLNYFEDYALIILLLLLFLVAYRKQTNYITKRIEANK